MQIINHQKDNYTHAKDGAVMRGTIYMTPIEWKEVSKWLGVSNIYDIGVSHTVKIFKKYNLPRYKQQNYRIIIK